MVRTGMVYRVIAGSVLALVFFSVPAQAYHSGDTNGDYDISLNELLRVIQFYNSPGFACEDGTEDGYKPGSGDRTCTSHDVDFDPQDWDVSLTELLRLIQFYNAAGYGFDAASADGFNPLFDPLDVDDTVNGEIGGLQDYLDGQPDDAVDPDTKGILIGLLQESEVLFIGGEPCDAADKLDEFLTLAQALRTEDAPSQEAAEALYAMGRLLQWNMVDSNTGQGGCPTHPEVGKEPLAEVPNEDTSGLSADVDFGAPRLLPISQGGKQFTQLLIPGLEPESGEPGAPAIPAKVEIIAVPPDAFVEASGTPQVGEEFFANLLPNTNQALDVAGPFVDPQFGNQPFYQNDQIYETDRAYPPNPVVVTPLGRMRGMDIYQLIVYAGQYNPVEDKVTLFDTVNVDITFSNGPAGFEPEWARDPFESNRDVHTGGLLNRTSVSVTPLIPDITQYFNIGEEYMILTHPDFRAAADALAAWKNQKGIMTNVYECGVGSGITDRDTKEEIDAFIEDHYSDSKIKARYILLLGDAEFIPPFYEAKAGAPGVTIGTDNPYAAIPVTILGITFDLLPTFALGRIPVDTLDQANVVVNKIIDYEQSPPGSAFFADDFYNNITFAAQFQCCRTDVDQVGTDQRTFIEMPESVRPALISRGYDVARLYTETVDSEYKKDATPRRFFDGTALPAAIAPGSGFTWNAHTDDVVDAINAGSFLVFHRDHGSPWGWGDPPFGLNDIDSLTNGAFTPVVFSVNCSSGVFDNETSGGAEGVSAGGVYFAEKLLRKENGGAVGVIGDTRVSPSWPNSVLARGFFDAVFPNAVPTYGSNQSKRRLGDILIHGKLYLLSQVNVALWTGPDEVRNEFFLYHVIGDPTLEIWTSDPNDNILSGGFTLSDLTRLGAVLSYPTSGAEITAYQFSAAANQLIPIGRGICDDGEVNLDFFETPSPGKLYLSATGENFVAGDGSVNIAFN